MATSTFFNNYRAAGEQNLVEDLIMESIKIFGIDFYYIPREQTSYDNLYTEDDMSVYSKGVMMEMFVSNFDGFEGDGNFMSKFGLEIRDRMRFTVSNRAFQINIGSQFNIARPREGDLIYYALNNKLFQIKYVENKPIHYPLGFLPTYTMFCELFEYSNEEFNTGIPEIDIIQEKFSTNIYDYGIMDENGAVITDENGNVITHEAYNLDEIDVIAVNQTLSNTVPTLVDFSETNPFGEVS